MKITIVAGARPNFMKIAPLIKAIEYYKGIGEQLSFRLVHTGQHYDKIMSISFFEQLGIPNPDINLECGGGTQAEQTAMIMVKFEKELLNFKPDVVIVVGDVTSTMACTITAKKLCIKVAHVEAGIRSGDIEMPEEINRIVTDAICDYYFTTTTSASEMLRRNQIPISKIHFVGNTMIDTLFNNINNLKKPLFIELNQIKPKSFFLLTLHRPSNVDDVEKLKSILDAIMDATNNTIVIFPVHPRTKSILSLIEKKYENLITITAQPYLEFLYLIKNTKAIITDSGGITEEATVLNIPCLTMRNSTERPETITMGTNELIGDNIKLLKNYITKIIEGKWKKGSIPPLWDGKTSDRIISILLNEYKTKSSQLHKVLQHE